MTSPDTAASPGGLSLGLADLVTVWAETGLPAAVSDKVRTHVADAAGIGYAAGAAPLGRQIIEATAAIDGAGAARVLGRSGPGRGAAGAAFVNAALIHALDFDDIHDAARLHPTAVTLPAALAAADLTGDHTLVEEATAIGSEIMCRLGLLVEPDGSGPATGWFLTQLLGYVGAATSAGVALRLNRHDLVSAIGLATMQAAGAKEAGFGTGSTARGIYPAFAAEGGLRAALLARSGVVGPPRGLDGEAGLLPLYLGTAVSPDAAGRLVDPHAPWEFLATAIKRWPCCRLSHPFVAAALQLRSSLTGREATRIVVHVNRSAARLCRPLPDRIRPRTLADARYSIPFLVALTLTRGAPSLDLTAAVLDDELILRTAARIRVVETGTDTVGEPPARIAITCGAMDLVAEVMATVRMSEPEIQAKSDSCHAHARAGDLDFVANLPLGRPGT